MSENNNDNLALKIAEERAAATSQMRSPEREVLDTVANYSLQFTSEQLEVLFNLKARVLLNKLVPEQAKKDVQAFIEFVKEHKRYHDSLFFVMDTVNSMHFKKMIEAGGGVKAQVIKTEH